MSRKIIELDRVGKQNVLGTFGIKFMKLLKPRYGYLIVLAIMLAELELLHSFSFSTPLYSNVLVYIKHIAFSLLDISSILLLSSLFLRYSNRALVVIHILFSILVLSNIWYVRFFDTYIPFDMYYGGASNMTEFLDSILPVLHFSDIFFIFSNVIVIYLLWNKRSNISRFSTCCFSLSLILASIFAIQRYISTKKNVFRQIIAETNISFSGGLYNYGFIVSYIGDLYFSNSGFNVIYSTKEIQYLSKYINTDNFIVNKETPQNLILIIVESLSSYPLNKSFAEMEITPNINRLINNASFFSDKMIDQTKYGISSDGQLIYMTGLIPFPNDATIFKCKNNTFKTLANLLVGYNTKATIPTREDCWCQKDANKSYGINSVISIENSQLIKDNCNDKSVFEETIHSDIETKKPFFSMVLTISTHLPYNEKKTDKNFKFPKYFSKELRNYLTNVNYLDSQLGDYIEKLKKNQLYDNSIIVILGDHLPPNGSLKMPNNNPCTHLPFIVLNAESQLPPIKDFIYQDCVFPTLLDLMSVKSKYRGVGQSLLMPDSVRQSSYELKRAELKQDISSMILSTDYFNK